MTCGWLSSHGSHTNEIKAAKLWQCYQAKRFVKFSNFKPGSEYDMSQVPNAESSLLQKVEVVQLGT